jgi:protein TonB
MRAKLVSLLIHGGVIALLLFFPWRALNREETPKAEQPPTRLYIPRLSRPDRGGGGMHSLTPVTRGQLPPIARRVFIPPMAVPVNLKPVLVLEAGLTMAPVDVSNVRMPNFGDPSAAPGLPSLGTGRDGIGNHGRSGVGNDDGAGLESRGGESGRMVGPEVIYHPEPEFSEDARKAKLQGVVVLDVQVEANGLARIVRVRQPLGLGLDEKAIEAVQRWRFRPATRNGKAVPASAVIYVNFRLL